MPAKICAVCGIEFHPSPAEYLKEKHCSASCRHDIRGRFWSKVDKSGECWVWTANKARGYGHFWMGTKQNGRDRLAHRVSYELTYGPIPPDTEVCHRCDNPSCVRPDHLFLGSHSTNMRDRQAKERANARRGEQASGARVTREIASVIRERYNAGGVTLKTLAAEYAIHPTTVHKIVRGETWRDAGA